MAQKMVIKSKSVEYMPLFLSLASLVNGICWTIYALIKLDPNMIVRNYSLHCLIIVVINLLNYIRSFILFTF
jgi:hypothetical protein